MFTSAFPWRWEPPAAGARPSPCRLVREREQDRRVGVRHEEPGDEILVAVAMPERPLPPLGPVGREQHALDVACMRHGDDHVLAGDQVLVVDIRIPIRDNGPALRREGLTDFPQFPLDDPEDPDTRAQDVEVVRRSRASSSSPISSRPWCGEALQAQIEDRTGLRLREAVGAVLVQLRWIVCRRDELR